MNLKNGLMTAQLGNNGKLTLESKLREITVQKQWEHGESNPDPIPTSVKVQLKRKVSGGTDENVGDVVN